MKDTIGEQPHSSTCPVAMTALAAFLASAGAWSAAPVDAEVASGPRLYMAGDSIMTEYTPDWFPQYGWGQSLKSFMKKPENLHNLARSGWSARRFRESGRWEKRIASALKPGDWVIVSFGHNDMNKRRNKPPKNDYSTLDEYKAFLRGFAADARAKGANIAFATSIAHSSGFGEKDGAMSVDGGAKGLGPYVAAMRETAAELGVPLLDLNRYAEEKLPKIGLEKAKALYMYVKPGEYANYPKGKQDAAHVRDAGAYFYARAAVEMAREQKLPLADLWKDPSSVQFVPSVSASNAAQRVGTHNVRVAGRGFPVTAEWVDSRLGFNTDFYEANCWEYSFFVPHDMDGLIRRCGGRDAFERRVAYALENNLVAFDNEPSFLIPWLFAYTGRGDLATKWAPRVATLFKGLDLPGDNDSGAMCALYVFIQLGFFPVAGQDLYLMHGSAYPKIVIRPRGGGKTFTIRSVNYARGRRVKSVTLNGKPHDPLFLRHAEIAAGGELVFTYE